MPLVPPQGYRKIRGIVRRGTRAAQPTATNVVEGTLYCVTDEAIVERSSGSAWETFPFAKGQIVFPAAQNASSDVNTLDDYEEGSWTPVIGGSGGTSGQTYAAQSGRYVKIGLFVFVEAYVQLSVKGTITGNVEIQGLPFAKEGVDDFPTGGLNWFNLATTWVHISILGTISSTALHVRGATAAATTSNTDLVTADLGNDSGFTLGYAYRAGA